MGLDGAQFQILHEDLRRLPTALQPEGDHAAGAIGHILLRQRIVTIRLQTAVLDPSHLLVALQEPGDPQGVIAMLAHPEGQALQPQIQIERILGRLDAAQIPHKLRRTLGDIGTRQTKPFGVGDAVVAFIRSTQSRELLRVTSPVEFSTVHDNTAQCRSMTIHVLGGGVGHDVCPPFHRAAVHRRCKGVVHDKRNAVAMGCTGKLLDVQHRQGRIGDGLPEDCLGVLPEGCVQLLVGTVRIHKSDFDAHALHGHAE